MGGTKAANAANAGATQSAQNATRLSNENAAYNTNLLNSLFGMGGKGGGTLSQFLNPASLNVNAPTGPYALQYQQAKAQGAQDTDFTKQAIQREANNAGFGSNSGYTGFLKSQADLGNAGNTGQLFSQFAGKSYQDALDNFWKATQMEQNTATNTGANAIGANQGASNTYANLYGSAPKINPYVGAILGAAGTAGAGALACVCEDTEIRLDGGETVQVQQLKAGAAIAGQAGRVNKLIRVERIENVPCVMVSARNGLTTKVSRTHTFALKDGGYVHAGDACAEIVKTVKGPSAVTGVYDGGNQGVYRLVLTGSHDYCADGFWGLE